MRSGSRQLNVSITPHFSNLIREKVKSGRYANASEVVREALRKLEQEEQLTEQIVIADPDDVVVQIRKGLSSVERGEYTELKGDRELHGFFEDAIARGKSRLAAKRRSARR